jgi:hypothetical protein
LPIHTATGILSHSRSKHVTQTINNKFLTLISSIQYMKNDTYHIKKHFILILTLYFLVSSTYILFIPGYSFSGITSRSTFNSSLALNIHHHPNTINTNNTNARIHHLYKSIPENKRKVLAALLLVSTLFTFLNLIGSFLLHFLRKQGNFFSILVNSNPHYYLKFCSIRI